MYKSNSILISLLRVAIALGIILAVGGLSTQSAKASSGPWYAVGTGTCSGPMITNQVVDGTNVLIVGGGLMPGSSFMYTVSSYGQTSRGLTWTLRRTGQADQSGNFCVVAFSAASNDQGNFKAQVNGVDYLMRQYNPAAQIFTITPAPAPTTEPAAIKTTRLPLRPIIPPFPIVPTRNIN